MAFQHFQHLISHQASAQQLKHTQINALWPAGQGLVGPAVASCYSEVLCSFTAAAPLKPPCASGDLPAEDLQDVGLKHFISGSQAVVPVTETVNQKAPTLHCNACACVCFCFLEPARFALVFLKQKTPKKLAVVSAAIARDLYC